MGTASSRNLTIRGGCVTQNGLFISNLIKICRFLWCATQYLLQWAGACILKVTCSKFRRIKDQTAFLESWLKWIFNYRMRIFAHSLSFISILRRDTIQRSTSFNPNRLDFNLKSFKILWIIFKMMFDFSSLHLQIRIHHWTGSVQSSETRMSGRSSPATGVDPSFCISPPTHPCRYALSLVVALGSACSCCELNNCISHFTFQIPTPCRIHGSLSQSRLPLFFFFCLTKSPSLLFIFIIRCPLCGVRVWGLGPALMLSKRLFCRGGSLAGFRCLTWGSQVPITGRDGAFVLEQSIYQAFNASVNIYCSYTNGWCINLKAM